MASLKDIFHITDNDQQEKLNKNAVNLMAIYDFITPATWEAMRSDLKRARLSIDGNLIGNGTHAVVFRPAGIEHSVVRLADNLDDPALQSAVLLKPFGRKIYQDRDGDDVLRIHMVPYAPDIPSPEGKPYPSKADIFNTLRVIKAEGLEHYVDDGLGDEDPAKHFVYLKDPVTKDFIRYPANASDSDMAGRPIAYIRDYNTLRINSQYTVEERDQAGFGTINTMLAKMGKRKEELTPAPEECVEACKQQSSLVARAQDELRGSDLRAFAREDKWQALRPQRSIVPGSDALVRQDKPLV